MADAAQTTAPDAPARGIAFLALGVCVFITQDVIIKLLSGGYPVHEMLWIRCITGLPLVLLLAWKLGSLRALRMQGPGVLRGILHIFSFTLYYLALATLPLAETATIYYANPLMITALSVPFLHEKVGPRRWLAVLVGFAGVVVVMQPDVAHIDPAMLYAVGAAFFYALSMMVNRATGKNVSSISFAVHSMVILFLASSLAGVVLGDGQYFNGNDDALAFLLRPWVMPVGWGLIMLMAIGPISAAGFLLLSEAYRIAPASLITPFEYASLPAAVVFGFVIFNELPQGRTWIGLALIVGAGLYILHRERVLKRKVNQGWPPMRPSA
jgi:drug/metabolite transporter (DMT)-like permease